MSGDSRCPIDTGGLWNHHSYEAILYGMGFLRDECREWYGENRPRPAVHKKVLEAIDVARDKLPPHDVWLQRMVGMANYSNS
jgi:tryptophan halogenase